MKIIEVDNIEIPELKIFTSLTEAQLRLAKDYESTDGLFIAESPNVIERAIVGGWQPVSLLCEQRHIAGDAAKILSMTEVPVYTANRGLLEKLTGYKLTRGVLCAMRRRKMPNLEQLCKEARRIAVLDGIVDSTNVGAIFRSAAALGIDAIIVTGQSCDPYNRRVVRVSMGAVFQIPWTIIENPVDNLHRLGFKVAAMALRENSYEIDYKPMIEQKKLAVMLGSEGYGLSEETIKGADYVVRIPMANNVDSLNVAQAATIAFWEMRKAKI